MLCMNCDDELSDDNGAEHADHEVDSPETHDGLKDLAADESGHKPLDSGQHQEAEKVCEENQCDMERECVHRLACRCQIAGSNTVFLASEEAVAYFAVAKLLDILSTQPALLCCPVYQNDSDDRTDYESDCSHGKTDITCIHDIVRLSFPDLCH